MTDLSVRPGRGKMGRN